MTHPAYLALRDKIQMPCGINWRNWANLGDKKINENIYKNHLTRISDRYIFISSSRLTR
jgi:hypothetical protein